MFHILEREMQWRREQGLNEGFEALRAYKPVVAVGAEDPLEAQKNVGRLFPYVSLWHIWDIFLGEC